MFLATNKLVVFAVAAALVGCAGAGGDRSPEPAGGGHEAAGVAAAPKAVEVSPPVAQPAPSGVAMGSTKAEQEAAIPTPLPEPEKEAAPEPVPPAPVSQPEPKVVEPVKAAPAVSAPVAAKPAAVVSGKRPEPVTVVADRVARTFVVNVTDKNASHPFHGQGSNLGFVVDGVQGRELVLARGVEYTFHVDTNVQHDFYLSSSPVGWGAGTYADGVTGQFTYSGDVTFTPGANAPGVLYYQCRNHKNMGGKLHVANAGDKVSLYAGLPSTAGASGPARVVSEAQVKQKLNYADMVINTSAAAKRIAASGNAEAKGLMAQAAQQLKSARDAAADPAKAMGFVDEALRLANSASRLVPDQTAEADHKGRYEELLDHIKGFEDSYARNLARTKKSSGPLDTAKFKSLVDQARGLGGKGQYEEANKLLDSANGMVTAALAQMLNAQTMVYDKSFATPQEEYEYELARYQSYEELVPIAIEERKPSADVVSSMNELVGRSREIQGEAMGYAKKGDLKTAILGMQEATERIQRALRLAGVQ